MRFSKVLISLFFMVSSTFSAAAVNIQERVVLVESKGDLPKPLLEQLVAEGTELEEATRQVIRSSATSVYAQAFTFYAICMSISDLQAERVRDIAIEAASTNFKNVVSAEAKFSMLQFKTNRCANTERTSRIAPVDNDVINETVASGASGSR